MNLKDKLVVAFSLLIPFTSVRDFIGWVRGPNGNRRGADHSPYLSIANDPNYTLSPDEARTEAFAVHHSHSSHASHASHASHSSHASHYSGSHYSGSVPSMPVQPTVEVAQPELSAECRVVYPPQKTSFTPGLKGSLVLIVRNGGKGVSDNIPVTVATIRGPRLYPIKDNLRIRKIKESQQDVLIIPIQIPLIVEENTSTLVIEFSGAQILPSDLLLDVVLTPGHIDTVAISKGINLRSGPGIQHEVLQVASRPLLAQVLEENELWLKVRTRETEVWVYKTLVEPK